MFLKASLEGAIIYSCSAAVTNMEAGRVNSPSLHCRWGVGGGCRDNPARRQMRVRLSKSGTYFNEIVECGEIVTV